MLLTRFTIYNNTNINLFSNKDRQLVFVGLVELGFTLLDTERKSMFEIHLPWQLGQEILCKVMKKRKDSVSIVIEKLNEKILQSGINVSQYTGITIILVLIGQECLIIS